jgi:hypothetical protein
MKVLHVVLSLTGLKDVRSTETDSILVWKPVASAGYFVNGSNKIRDQNKVEILIICMTLRLKTFFHTAS